MLKSRKTISQSINVQSVTFFQPGPPVRLEPLNCLYNKFITEKSCIWKNNFLVSEKAIYLFDMKKYNLIEYVVSDHDFMILISVNHKVQNKPLLSIFYWKPQQQLLFH